MTMFETIKEKTAKLFGIEHTDFASVSKAASDLIEQNGGIPGLQAKFNSAGMGDIFQSWVSNSQDKISISAEQLQKIFGSESLRMVADKIGLSPEDFSAKLAEYLPKIIDTLTPDVRTEAPQKM